MTTLAKPKENTPVLATKTEEIRKISVLSHIWHSDQYQSREKVNDLVVRKYKQDFIAYGGWGGFPMPIAYELPGDRLEIVAGFHRGAGYKRAINEAAKAGKTFDPEIAVRVIKGTEKEAILASIEDNNLPDHTGLKLLEEDRRKAAAMLIRNEETRVYSDQEIAKRVGMGASSVTRLRSLLRDTDGIPFPEKVMMFLGDGRPKGRMQVYRKKPGSLPAITRSRNSKSPTGLTYSADIDGKAVYLGNNPDSAEKNLSAEIYSANQRRFPSHPGGLPTWASRRGISMVEGPAVRYIGGRTIGNVAIAMADPSSLESIFAACAKSMIVRSMIGGTEAVVACDRRGRSGSSSAAINAIHEHMPGVRVLDADEFIAHFGGTPADEPEE
jgi:hypothetical protein